MNIADIQYPVFEPYKKPALEVYIQGCNRGCIGCHNPELLPFDIVDNIDNYLRKMESRRIFYDVISITGGDLLQQQNIDAFMFCREIQHRFPEKELWLFTGSELQDVPDWAKQIFDYIKTGPYKQELKQEGFPSSSNQRLNKKGLDY